MASSMVNGNANGGATLIADGMPEALRQSHNYMKRCFGKFVEKGNRSLKVKQLIEEMELVVEDKTERNRVMEGVLGLMLTSTQVRLINLSIHVQ